MKLLKRDRKRLETVLDNLKRGLAYVNSPDIALMRQHRHASVDFFASTFPDYAGQKWSPICKEIGSEYCLAMTAARDLQTLLEQPE